MAASSSSTDAETLDFGDFDFDNFSDFSEMSDEELDKESLALIADDIDEDDGCSLCVCQGRLSQEMIACHGERCPVQWFHLDCVGLNSRPVGSWYCTRCSTCTSTTVSSTAETTESSNVEGDTVPASGKDTTVATGHVQGDTAAVAAEDHSKKGKGKRKGKSKATGNNTGQGQASKSGKKDGEASRAKVVERPPVTMTKEAALNDAVSYFSKALHGMRDNPIFNMDNDTNVQVLALIMQVILFISSPYFEQFCITCTASIWAILDCDKSNKLKPEVYEKGLKSFHQLKHTLTTEWDRLLQQLNINTTGKESLIVFHFMLQSVLLYIIQSRNNCNEVAQEAEATWTSINKDEETVLRYVAGYIPYALLKKYRKQKNLTAEMYCRFLSSWQVTSKHNPQTFLEYTKQWIETQNRGGLFKVSDNVYILFRAMEQITQTILRSDRLHSLQGVNVKELLTNKISQNVRVQNHWCSLIKEKLNGEASKTLFDVIVLFYVKIRCKAFIRVYLDIQKATSSKVSKKGEKGLRKSLKTSEKGTEKSAC